MVELAEMPVRLCVDCRWFSEQDDGSPLCAHADAKRLVRDLVHGGLIEQRPFCVALRFMPGVLCGSEGKWFEKRKADADG